ncbi:hypothetical protein Asera_04580 [Actinocatenispora sera]|uniref:Uncharacterized protein n=1 Tax=Actinocatenispora sera TaxID=390989 RepID=A0A810KTC0_9ACTN|nr:hypothetical protein Asera_04580 [Actinocatenispora sera]
MSVAREADPLCFLMGSRLSGNSRHVLPMRKQSKGRSTGTPIGVAGRALMRRRLGGAASPIQRCRAGAANDYPTAHDITRKARSHDCRCDRHDSVIRVAASTRGQVS